MGQVTVELYAVSFSNSHLVYRDTLPQSAYPRIWLDRNLDGYADDWATDLGPPVNPFAGDIRAPICYTVGTPVTVDQAIFVVSNPALVQKVIGSVDGVDEFENNGLSYNGNILTATITGSAGTSSTIARIADYTITWRVEIASTPVPISAGSSKNHMHWVLQSPTGNFLLYYSLIDIGCTRAHGQTSSGPSDDFAIAQLIFAEFADKHVLRSTDVLEGVQNPKPMTYWRNWWTAQLFLGASQIYGPGMLARGDGKCGAWGQFFYRCIHAVGLEPPYMDTEVTLGPRLQGANVLFVPTWNPGGQSNADGPMGTDYPSINIPEDKYGDPAFFTGQTQYYWRMADYTDQDGIKAQGMDWPVDNPHSLFGNHGIVRVWASNYFDPSYGTTYTSLQQVDDAFQAFGVQYGMGAPGLIEVDEGHVNLDLDGDWIVEPGVLVYTPALILKANPAQIQITINPTDVPR